MKGEEAEGECPRNELVSTEQERRRVPELPEGSVGVSGPRGRLSVNKVPSGLPSAAVLTNASRTRAWPCCQHGGRGPERQRDVPEPRRAAAGPGGAEVAALGPGERGGTPSRSSCHSRVGFERRGNGKNLQGVAARFSGAVIDRDSALWLHTQPLD